MLPIFALLSLRNLFVSASPDADEDDGIVEDVANPGEFPGFPGGKMPTPEELLRVLDSMTGLSDEDKEALRQDLLKKGGAAANMAQEAAGHLASSSSFVSEFFMLIGLLALISLIFVFFGYKLYKSLAERERKREEKKKNKQMKKKK